MSDEISEEAAARESYRGHLLSLDSFRFLAASFIVLFHYDQMFQLNISARIPAIRGLDIFVDFFFILSGFVIARSYATRVASWPTYLRFLQKRFARIYPLHLLALALTVAMVLLAHALHAPINNPEIYEWNGLLPSIFLVQAWGDLDHGYFNLPAWSLSAEQFVYILFPMLVIAASRLPLVLNCLLIVGFVLAFQYTGLVPPGSHWNHVSSGFGNLRAVPTFFAGILLYYLLERQSFRLVVGWGWIYAMFLASLVGLLLAVPDELVLLLFAAVICLAAKTELAGRRTMLQAPLFARLGNASYAIYLLHHVIDIPIVLAARKLGLLHGGMAALVAIATYVGCVVLSVYCFEYFENPARRFLSNLRFNFNLRRRSTSSI